MHALFLGALEDDLAQLVEVFQFAVVLDELQFLLNYRDGTFIFMRTMQPREESEAVEEAMKVAEVVVVGVGGGWEGSFSGGGAVLRVVGLENVGGGGGEGGGVGYFF